ncbi:MAG: hypothetical protein RBR63_10180 [Methanosarcina vacuolata]|nr:hypothetical protein [Methanosarcina vacuolata]
MDPALIWPGRFDEMIFFPIPYKGACREIFKVHAEKWRWQRIFISKSSFL